MPFIGLGHEDVAGQERIGFSRAFKDERTALAERDLEVTGMRVFGGRASGLSVVAKAQYGDTGDSFGREVEHASFRRVDIIEREVVRLVSHMEYNICSCVIPQVSGWEMRVCRGKV